MTLKQLYLIFALSVLFLYGVYGQKPEVIKLDNPSFEDYPSMAHPPQGWFDCGFPGETPTDVQPGSFQVMKPAQNGKTYVGMVTRDVNTWEAIGQKLKSPIMKGTDYRFSIYVCRSELYMSQSQLTRRDVNYITPTVLRIWGGSSPCGKDELLGETGEIINSAWEKKEFIFKPHLQHEYFSLEIFYKTPTLFTYNGNLMIDNASDIVPVPEKKPVPAVIAQVKPKPNPPKLITPRPKLTTKPDSNSSIVSKPDSKQTDTPKPKTDSPVTIASEIKTKIAEGKILKIENLQFATQSAVIDQQSYPSLDEMYNFLAANQNLIVEIGGHTNLIIDDESGIKLSKDRAQAVADYFINKGIDRNRLKIKGYGKSHPLVNGKSHEDNLKNQRVEIKILSING